MANLILVGAGQIGTRHLQAVARCGAVGGIRIVEPSAAGRSLAATRWAETNDPRPVPVCHEVLHDIPSGWADVAIVATSAARRRGIVEDLLQLGVRHILIEKLAFQHPRDYDRVLGRGDGASIYVNCVYRYATVLKEIRKRLPCGGRFELRIDSGDIGMATNLPHWTDILSYLAGVPVGEMQVTIDGIARESKRGGGMREFAGEAVAAAGDGILRAICRGPARAPIFRIKSDSVDIEIDEHNGSVRGDIPDLTAIGFTAPMVSQTTTLAIAQMLAGNCALPTLGEVAPTDRTMLRAVARALCLDELAEVPIT
mgnify:CR=1 FL=1